MFINDMYFVWKKTLISNGTGFESYNYHYHYNIPYATSPYIDPVLVTSN